MRPYILGIVFGVLAIAIAAFLYLQFGNVPVSVADRPFALEKQLVKVALHARIGKEMPASAPIPASENNLLAGAQIYREQCAFCHGLIGHESTIGAQMYPHTPQLWARHGNGVVGVSDDPVGETYWKVANGIRLTGMPAFKKTLNETQMWQVTLLLANADKPVPNGAMNVLNQPLEFSTKAEPALSQVHSD